MLTLSQARTALFKYASNVTLSSATAGEKLIFDDALNMACERFINSGKPRASRTTARITCYNRQITLPRVLETILKGNRIWSNTESADEPVCGCESSIFNSWYTIGLNEYGNPNECCIPGLIDLGENFATFRDVEFDFKVRAVPRITEPNTATILLRGLDSRGDEIFSSTDTRGESITIHTTNVTSTKTFSRLQYWVKSAATRGVVDLWAIPQDDYDDLGHIGSIETADATIDVFAGAPAPEIGTIIRIGTATYTIISVTDLGTPSDSRYDYRYGITVSVPFSPVPLAYTVVEYKSAVTTNVQTMIASIFPGEMVSNYRRYAVDAEDGDKVQALCKRQYIAAVNDNDPVIPANYGALKLGLMALRFEDTNDWDRSEQMWQRAFALLDADRQEFDGDSALPIMNFDYDFGAGSIPAIL